MAAGSPPLRAIREQPCLGSGFMEVGFIHARNLLTLAVQEGRAQYQAAPTVRFHRSRGRPCRTSLGSA